MEPKRGNDGGPTGRTVDSDREDPQRPHEVGRFLEGLPDRGWDAALENAAKLGHRDLLGSIRPTGKSGFPHEAMADYVARLNGEGLPVDPWLRTHVRLGGVVMQVCPVAMTIPGTLAQWRGWTCLGLASSGAVEVPGALNPVHVSVEQEHGVYVEPNVWIRHQLAA